MPKYYVGLALLMVTGTVAVFAVQSPKISQGSVPVQEMSIVPAGRGAYVPTTVDNETPLKISPNFGGSDTGLGGYATLPSGLVLPIGGDKINFSIKRAFRENYPTAIRTVVKVLPFKGSCCGGGEDAEDPIFELACHERLVNANELVNEVLPIPVHFPKSGYYRLWVATEQTFDGETWRTRSGVTHKVMIP